MNENKGDNILERKLNGVFYTPDYIAKYIVSNTLGLILKQLKTELKSIKKATELKPFFNKVKNLKILDPACGDGVFLIEILHEMTGIYRAINQKINSFPQTSINRAHLDLEKIEYPGIYALCNNIYGVDKDESAILETCSKLSSMVGNKKNSSSDFLINLNIKVGNSLINSFTDEDGQINKEKIEKILELRKKLMDFKGSFNNHEELKIKINDIMVEINETFKHRISKYFDTNDSKYDAFNWQLEFPEVFFDRSGFDVIIGNPPYVRVHKQDAALKRYLRDFYMTPKMDFDVYICFFELALRLLKKEALLSYIVPDKFLTREYAENLRYLLLNNTKIIELYDLSRCNIFKASAYPIIITLKKEESQIIRSKKIVNSHQNTIDVYQIGGKIQKNLELLKNSPKIYKRKIEQEKFTKNKKCRIYINVDEIYDVIEKLEKLQKLQNFVKSQNILCGTPRSKDYHGWKNYISETVPTSGEYLKYIVCRNLTPFNINWGIPINSFKKTFSTPYFIFEDGSMPSTRWENFKKVPKILIRGNDVRLTAVLDEEGHVFVGIYSIIQDKYPYSYLIALINSDLLNAYFFHKNPSIKVRGGYFSINSSHLMQLPIHPTSKQNIKLISDMVSDIIELKARKINTKKEALDGIELKIEDLLNQLNEKIYQIYELDASEIHKIESFLKQNRFLRL